jgi:hypothetical protein
VKLAVASLVALPQLALQKLPEQAVVAENRARPGPEPRYEQVPTFYLGQQRVRLPQQQHFLAELGRHLAQHG